MQTASPRDGSAVAQCRFPRFEIHADRCPQVLPRVAGLFAAQALIPRDLYFRQSCGGMWIALHADVTPATSERIAAKLRAMVSVNAVILIPGDLGHR